MTTFLRVKSLTSVGQANLAAYLRFITVSLVLFFAFVAGVYAQTTYTWVGGNGTWATAANWSPARTILATTDILQFNDGGTYAVTGMPSQTIGKLLVTNNTDITLSGSGNQTLTITGPTGQTNFLIEAGSSLTNSPAGTASGINFTANGQLAEVAGTYTAAAGGLLYNATISGTLNIVMSSTNSLSMNNATYPSRVTSTGIINHTSGGLTATAASLTFEAGSTYNYLASTTLINMPIATWNAASNVNITGITTLATIGNFSGQSFGNFTYDCPLQTSANSLQNATTTTTVKGNFTVNNTGSGSVILATLTSTLAINGDLIITGGTFNVSNGAVVTTINLDGNYNQTGGTFTRINTSNVTTLNFRGANKTYTQSGGTVPNGQISYTVASAASLTLNNAITLGNGVTAGRTFTVANGGTLNLGAGIASFGATAGSGVQVANGGTLICGTNTVTGTGLFGIAAGGIMHIGSQDGITTAGATGNIQSSGTRTYNVGAQYIYTGTTGQLTGNGLPLNITGVLGVNLDDDGALTLTNTANFTIGAAGRLRIIRGSLANAAKFPASNATLEYAGTAPQTTNDNEFPTVNPPYSLLINNASGVTLHAPRTLGTATAGVLTMTNGLLNTDVTNVLTVANATAAGVAGGSASSYINGPLIRSFNTGTGIFSFPVGKTSFGELELTLGTSPGGATKYRVEYFETTPAGAVGTGLSAIGNSYWEVQRLTGVGTLTNIGVTVTQGGIVTDSRIGFSPDNAATAYMNIGGTGPAGSISSTSNTSIAADGYYTVGASGTLSGTITTYNTLAEISTALNIMLVTGDVIFELPLSYIGEVSYPVTFSQFNTDGNPWTITIRPAAGSPVLLTAGDPGASPLSLIELNGVDRLYFDGRAGGVGSTVGWIFRNTRTTGLIGGTFRFQNDATNNTLTYLQIESQCSSGSGGTVFFSTSPSGALGNSDNTVSFCEIRDRVTGGTALPLIGVYSAGSATAINSNNTISGCLIYNYYSNATTTISAGIRLDGNTSAWTIQNNKFFQTVSRAPVSVQPITGIYIGNTSGNNFTITGNAIGGDNASGSGTMTYTSSTTALMAPIYLNIGSTPSSLVENNTITNISFTSTSGASSTYGLFSGIYLAAGSARILNNTIGAASGTGAITVTVSNSGAVVNAIKSDATGTVRIENNHIASMTFVGTGTNNSPTLYGIHFTAGNVVAKNNTIGSLTPSSMQIVGTATTNTGILAGINGSASATYTDSLINNEITNLRNNNSGTGTRVAGIVTSSGGQYIIDDNTIWNISTASTSISTTSSASVIGISLNTSNTQALSVSGNVIHSLANSGSANASIIGIYFSGGSSTSNRVDRNFVHTFSPSAGTASPLIGIQLASTLTASNNMVRLGIQPGGSDITQSALIYGVDVTTTAATNILHNSVYITGAVAGVTATNSFAFRRTAASGTINIQNNIFMNTRTQSSGGKHYAIYTPNITAFTSNYNVLYATGTGTYTGLFSSVDQAALANWRTATTNKDLNSLACDPGFVDANGDEANVDLHIDGLVDTPIEGRGNPAALSPSITVDYDGATRDVAAINMVDIGADAGSFTAPRAPTLTPTANGSSSLSTCVNSAVTFAAVPSGGTACGAWEYSWYDGANYWNGTAFASAVEVFNTAWENISVASLSTGSIFTVKVRCSGDAEDCIAPQQGTVNVSLNGATTLTATIGNPANGLSHNMNISWTAAAGATDYEVEYSTDNVGWNALYSGTNLSYTHDAGNNPNTPYYYRIRSVFGMTSCNWVNAVQFPIYTAADAPALPTLNNPTPYTFDLTLANETPIINPAITTYSIFCTTNNLYVQANGSLGASEVFQTKATWGTVTVTGLVPSTNYCFYAKARNQDGDIRMAQGSTILPTESFTTNANFSTGTPTNMFCSPSSCSTGGLTYSASSGCSDGAVGKTGTFTGLFGCYLRTPSINCSGNTSTTLTFDVSNSYFASQPLDRIRFYMFADGAYKTGACTSVKINGVEVSTTSGSDRYLPFNVARTCTTVDVTFDMTTTTNLTNVLFYIEPSNGYNNSNLYSVTFDNISLSEGTPDICLSTAPLVLNGGYTVGTGGDYPSLTNPGGLFEAVNMAQLSGNVTATIISDLTVETGLHPLNQWVEQGVGGYTLTIQPSDNTTRLIEGTYVGAAAASAGLYRFNGADQVIIDGRDPGNISGGGRHLLFRNLSATNSAFNSTFNLINDATYNIFRYCVIEGATIGATNGVFRISTAGANGNDNNTIDNCQIRDRSNATGNPLNGIYALGTFNKENNNITISNNEIFNMWAVGASTNGISISDYNTDWDITGNSFYQTATRTSTGISVHAGIRISNSTGTNFNIDGNYIGGSQPLAAGTAWTQNGTVNATFIGMSIDGSTGGSSTIQNNTVANINWRCGNNSTTAKPGIFTAIYTTNGGADILNNTVGSSAGTGAILVTSNTAGPYSYGIAAGASSGTVSITGNTIESFTTAGSGGTISHSFVGIDMGQAGSSFTRTISNNTIGSLSTANSINASTASTSATPQAVYGIRITTGANPVVITDNTISNLYNNYAGVNAGGQIIGIQVPFGESTINNNIVTNLSASSLNTGSGSNTSVMGICNTSPTANRTISGNTVHSLKNTSTVLSFVTGIFYSGSTSGTNTIAKNLVHSLSTGSTGAAVVNGIYLSTGSATVSNNMVRLGIDADGSSLTNANMFVGITKDNTSANCNIYYNSVYIGGTGVSTTATSTFAFRRLQVGASDNVRNNIFFNARSNTTTGGKHYGVYLVSANTLTMNYNVIFANGTGNVFGQINGTDYATLSAWLLGTTFDDNSASADPQFLDPTAGTPDLHLDPAVATLAESAATPIGSLTDDFDATNTRAGYPQAGQINGGGTAPDIGADEGDFISIDFTPPSFTYTNIGSQVTACLPIITTVNVTITDGQSGLSLMNNLPRMYFRRSTGGAPGDTWSNVQFVEGAYVSGDAYASEWQFTLAYSDFGIAPATNNIFEYYFVAQDEATVSNVGYSQTNGTTPMHSPDVAGSSVLTSPSFSFGANGTYTFVTPLSGTVSVGAGQTYTSLNEFGVNGLFYNLMNRGISGNLEVLVTSDINESGLYTILGIIPEYCGTGYTVTIRPSAGTVKTIYQTTGGNPLINLQGCQRIIFDGSFAGSGRYLTFAARQNTPAFYFNGITARPTSDIQIKNCTIEGNSQLTTSVGPGVINFAGLLGVGQAIQDITIDNNIIRNRSDLAQTAANSPNILIHAGGTNAANAPVKSNIIISNNELFNFRESAIVFKQNSSTNGIGDNISITGNKIYEPIIYNLYVYPVHLEGGDNSKGHTISGNLIGGNASPSPNITGTWTNNKIDGEIAVIYTLNGGTSLADGINISNNTIANITLTGTDYTNFIGMRNEYGYAQFVNNTINNINNYGSGGAGFTDNSATVGIWNQDENEVLIEGNTVSNMRAYYSTGILPYQYVVGIQHGSNHYLNGADYSSQPGGKAVVRNNQVYNLSSGSLLASLSISPDALTGIFYFSANGTAGNEISGNSVHGLNVTEAWSNAANNTRVYAIGIGLGGYGSTQTGMISSNKIYDINNNSRANAPEINGLTIAGGNWNVSNNMISLSNSDYPVAYPLMNGIYDWMTAGRTGSFHNNTVLMSGTVGTGGLNSSYAYIRLPNGLGNVLGANITLRNNIFLNDRTGNGTNNVAIGNFTQGISSDAAVGWNSDYNLLLTRNTNQVGRWIGTTAGDRTFANWKTTSNGDASSWSVAAATSSSNTQLNFTDLFTDAANGDLTIWPDHQASWFVNGKGVAGYLMTDQQGNARTGNYGYGIDLGANEFTPNMEILPHELVQTPSLGGTNTFTFAGRTIGSITWGSVGSIPTTIAARYYSGEQPGANPSPAYAGASKADFMTEFTPTGGSGYTYNTTLRYDDALLGDYVTGEGNMRMIKTLSSSWIDVISTVDSIDNTLTTSSSLTSFSFFSGGTTPSPLPIELLNFDANCSGENVRLEWSTASEINNEEFTIHRSADLIIWEKIITISGAGNSNQIRNYSATDDRPLNGLAYYKLSQHDYDGTTETFMPVSVNCYSDGSGNMMSVYPNPATDNFKVSITMAQAVSNATIIINDMNGKNILQRNINLSEGTNEFSFDTQGINLGTYIIQLKSADVTIKPVKLIIK